MSFRQGHISVKREAARLEQSLTDDLSSVFHSTSRAMGLALHAAAEWFRPDPDELFDAAALEDDIARLLTAAKVHLDAAMAAKLGIDVLGYYDVRTVAHAVAMRYRDGASIALLEAWQAGESVEQAAERLDRPRQILRRTRRTNLAEWDVECDQPGWRAVRGDARQGVANRRR